MAIINPGYGDSEKFMAMNHMTTAMLDNLELHEKIEARYDPGHTLPLGYGVNEANCSCFAQFVRRVRWVKGSIEEMVNHYVYKDDLFGQADAFHGFELDWAVVYAGENPADEDEFVVILHGDAKNADDS